MIPLADRRGFSFLPGDIAHQSQASFEEVCTDALPTADAELDPQHPDHPVFVVGEGWAEWGTLFVVPKAGCYVVEVSWAAGHWSVTFAAAA